MNFVNKPELSHGLKRMQKTFLNVLQRQGGIIGYNIKYSRKSGHFQLKWNTRATTVAECSSLRNEKLLEASYIKRLEKITDAILIQPVSAREMLALKSF